MKDMPVTLRLEGDAAAVGKIELVATSAVHLKPEEQANGSFFLVLPRSFVTKRKMNLKIGLYDGENRVTTLRTNFTGPFMFD